MAIRPTSLKPDRFSHAFTALAFLLFPLMVFLSHYEWRLLTSLYLGSMAGAFSLVGVIALLIGSFILVASRIQIGHYGRPRITIEEDHHLITDRMYRHVRNPQYLGFLLIFLGYSLSFGSLIIILITVTGLFLIFRSRMKLEERILLEAFGEEYAEYMRRTSRLMPRVY